MVSFKFTRKLPQQRDETLPSSPELFELLLRIPKSNINLKTKMVFQI